MRGLVTGSSSGIGLAIAEALLEAHPELSLVGLSRRPGPLATHPRFAHWATDMTCLEEVKKRCTRFRQEENDCDILVHAAGRGLFSPSDTWSKENIQDLLNLNLSSAMLLCGRLSSLVRKSEGLVVLIGSTAGRERAPLGAAYAASKAGLKAFAENFFQENRKQGVRVCHLCPGMTSTDFHREERFGPKSGSEFSLTPEAIAELVLFFFRGPGQGMNPSHIVVEPQRVGVEKRP